MQNTYRFLKCIDYHGNIFSCHTLRTFSGGRWLKPILKPHVCYEFADMTPSLVIGENNTNSTRLLRVCELMIRLITKKLLTMKVGDSMER